MSVHFKTVRWQNLLSTGNIFTEVFLDKSKSTLIVGNNGCGKSTLLDALHFGLFGKPFRNINKPQLINSITNKNMLVEIEFVTNNKQYLIRRGIKPNVFEIYQNDKLINESSTVYDYQDFLESNILRFNSKTFKQIVVLGSADYIPFMQLNGQSRRDVIEDLLDIQIFTTMSLILREKASSNKGAITSSDYDLSLLQEKINIHTSNMERITHDLKQQADQRKQEILQLEQQNADLNNQRQQLLSTTGMYNQLQNDKQKMLSKINAANQFSIKYQKAVASLDKEVSFYQHSSSCPTCKQNIDEDFKITKIQTLYNNRTHLDQTKEEAEAATTKIQSRLSEINAQLAEIESTNKQINEIDVNLQINQRMISNLGQQIENSLKQDTNTEEMKKVIEELNVNLVQAKLNRKQLDQERMVINICQTLLKDGGIKSKIVKQYIPIINKLINKYLAALDFFVNFEIDENFNETIKSRHRDQFSYASFSEGEKLKIDLALMLTWRAIAKMRNSAATNLLIMDETFDSSLDATGTEELLKILDEMGEDTNIFVISHKGESLYDKFHSVIRFQKHNGFSKIVGAA